MKLGQRLRELRKAKGMSQKEVADNIGIDSVWVRWYINTPNDKLIRHFKLLHTTGNNYAAAFNSNQSEVNYNDIIYYKIFILSSNYPFLSHNQPVHSSTGKRKTFSRIILSSP